MLPAIAVPNTARRVGSAVAATVARLRRTIHPGFGVVTATVPATADLTTAIVSSIPSGAVASGSGVVVGVPPATMVSMTLVPTAAIVSKSFGGGVTRTGPIQAADTKPSMGGMVGQAQKLLH